MYIIKNKDGRFFKKAISFYNLNKEIVRNVEFVLGSMVSCHFSTKHDANCVKRLLEIEFEITGLSIIELTG